MEEFVRVISEQAKSEFAARRTLLSFDDYLTEVAKAPQRHLRSAAHYLSDVIDHFGAEQVELPTGTFTRYRLFDQEFDQGRGKVIGQERVQEQLVRQIENFVRAGRVDRMVLMHGPNGSAKTSIIQALSKAAENYSDTDDGAIYQFNWVFPTGSAAKGSLGFGGERSQKSGSYAHIHSDEIEARLPDEFKDSPLLLLGQRERDLFFTELREKERLPSDFHVPDVLQYGDLSTKNRRIFNALMTTYQGDVEQVYRHIQVERFYLSRRYCVGIVAVEPQMSVDAFARQVTADRSLASLPTSLQHMSLYETGGALSDANRGILEFNDLLKRPIEAWKYLLVATEQAHASLDNVQLFLDLIILGSSNDLHLNAFKEHPDWPSFKGRIDLVTTPYLLRVSDEEAVYQDQVPRALHGKHIAPHALEIAAKWAVLTRLEAPVSDVYPDAARELVTSISPAEKMRLYDDGTVPERLSQKERRLLRQITAELYAEYKDQVEYEGCYGASVREVRSVLLSAAQDPRFDHLSPVAVFDELRALVRETSTYSFLRREPVRGFRDAAGFVNLVEAEYIGVLDEEVRTAMGLVDEGSHTELFGRYLKNVSAWTKGEKLSDPLTGKMRAADEDLMKQVEGILLAEKEDAEEFRRSVIGQIGAYRLEHPDDDVDYELLFGSHMRKLKEDFFNQRRQVIERVEKAFFKVLEGEDHDLDKKDKEIVQTLRNNLTKMGYTDSSAKTAIAYLLKQKT